MSTQEGPKDNVPQTEEAWLECLDLPEYIKMIPTGHLVPIVGPDYWIDGNGDAMNTKEYIEKYGFNPQIAWEAIKTYRKNAGKKDKMVYL